jgi:V-type H+-transporting ATPase subunit E
MQQNVHAKTPEMSYLPSKDVERMIAFINHEADEKIKEMKIKSIQEYNTEKARVIRSETMKEEEEFVLRQKKIEMRRIMAENSLVNSYRLKYLEEKAAILDGICEEVSRRCGAVPLDASLVRECIDRLDGDYIVYTLGRDRGVVERELEGAELREMDGAGLGGIILCSKDHRTVVDNSYLSRIQAIRKSFASEISKGIFGL